MAYVADTTYPPYWWLEILAGLTVLCAVGMRRLRRVRPVALSVLAAAVVAAAFVVVYSEELIGLL